MSNKQNIHFYGSYPLCSERDILDGCPYASAEGIYLWTVKQLSGNYRISYIGETGMSFYNRSKEHLVQTLGGYYQIFDAEAMKRGEYKRIWDSLWRKETRNKFAEFFSNYEVLAPDIKKYVASLEVFVAPIKIEVRLRRRIEGALADLIKDDGEASSIFEKDVRYNRRKDSEEPILFTLSSDKPIDGLPEQLEV